ncbi:MAG TPA: hypothetical protein VKJ65_04625, partial [Phycisphaerae bacterium]|nr:hypothetical protein [Phycisphaerae bacterium]
QMYETATIIAGVDTSTGWLEPHIYCIRRNSFECCDAVGYATIGSGARHVDAQFMQANFTRHFSLPKVIFLSYLAKRRAEKAPGVGKQTDMFLLGPTLAVNKNLESDLDYKEMNKMYDEIVKSDEAKTESMRQKLAEFLKDKLPFTPSEYDLKNIQSDT